MRSLSRLLLLQQDEELRAADVNVVGSVAIYGCAKLQWH